MIIIMDHKLWCEKVEKLENWLVFVGLVIFQPNACQFSDYKFIPLAIWWFHVLH